MTRRLAPALAAFAVIAVLLALGVLVLGRIAPGSTEAMGLTAAWFAIVGAVGLVLVRRRRTLLAPLASGYVTIALATAIVLGGPMLGDDAVDEQVAVAAPAPAQVTA